MKPFLFIVTLSGLWLWAGALSPGVAYAKSDVPPEGPPWMTDLIAAHAKAVKSGKPIFLYFTKTY